MDRPRRHVLAILVAAFVLLVTARARAHGLRTAFVEIATAPGHAVVVHRVSVPDSSTALEAGPGCTLVTAEDGPGLGAAITRTFELRCDDAIAGHALSMRGLGPVIGEATVRVVLADGREESALLTAAAPTFEIPRRASGALVLRQYVGLGVVHILTGADHLLFLLALVLLVRRVRAVLVTESAFTLSHSLSFGATSLGLVHVSSLAAEACIALSLALVAMDVGVRGAATTSHGARLAFVFGLVHGLGFAGGLSELGLPRGYAASALVGFGAGVEIGQVLFLAVLLVALRLVARTRAADLVPRVGAYAVGAVGVCWLIERTVAMFAS